MYVKDQKVRLKKSSGYHRHYDDGKVFEFVAQNNQQANLKYMKFGSYQGLTVPIVDIEPVDSPFVTGDRVRYKAFSINFKGQPEPHFVNGFYLVTIPEALRKDNNCIVVLDSKGNARRVATVLPPENNELTGHLMTINGEEYRLEKVTSD